MNELNPMSANRNLLKELHDTIYQWAETIPSGGVQVDISNALVSTYESYQRQEAAEKERRAKELEAASLNSYLTDEDYDYDDDIYDDDYDDEDSAYDNEDALYED
jgi:hypothetical protein